jgi:molybdenum cofactor cytidylyltransferase
MGSVSGILLAAGESTRMRTPKALLDWDGKSLLESQVNSLRNAGVSDIIVVLGHYVNEFISVLNNYEGYLQIVENSNYWKGKTTSIIKGLENISADSDMLVLLAVDQPRPANLIATLISSHRNTNALITHPSYEGKGGHPLIFDKILFKELAVISEKTEGIRNIVKKYMHRLNVIQVNNPIVRVDINTPEDYLYALSIQEEGAGA